MSVDFSVQTADPERPGYPMVLAWGPNVSNHNAGVILHSLGFTDEDLAGGEVDAADLAARIAIAQVVGGAFPDHGTPDVEIPGTGARMIDCGLPEGYLAHRYDELAELAACGVAAGEPVGWA